MPIEPPLLDRDITDDAAEHVSDHDAIHTYLNNHAVGRDLSSVVSGLPYALVVDEATTNYITNPSFEVDTAGWTQLSGTLSKQAGAAKIGGFGGRLVTTANSQAIEGIFADGVAAAGQTWTLSLWIKIADGKEARVTLSGRDSGNGGLANLADTGNFTTRGLWKRIVLTGTAPASTAKLRVEIEGRTGGAQTIEFDGFQLEQKSYATTYCDGSLGPDTDYAWSGTAHASTSTRSAGLKIVGIPQGGLGISLGDDGLLNPAGLPRGTDDVLAYVELFQNGVSSISVSGLPQNYRHLELIAELRLDADVEEDARLRFNGDSSAIYNGLRIRYGSDGNSSNSVETSVTGLSIGRISRSADNGDRFAYSRIFIPSYSQTNRRKIAMGQIWRQPGSGLGYQDLIAAAWDSSAAITSITINTWGGSNLAAGTKLWVIGKRG